MVKNRLLVVYNPTSGRSRDEVWEKLQRVLADTHAVDSLNIKNEELSGTLLAPYQAVAVCGGDGTLRTVVQQLLNHRLDIPIALIPRGSANVFARSLGLPFSLRAAADIIREGKTVAIDVGRLSSGEYFLAAFALGYLSGRVAAADQKTKNRLGFGGYLWSFLKERRLPLHHFEITVDGTRHDTEAHSLMLLNASNLFGMRSKRVKDLRDGIFELVVTTNKTFLSLVRLLYDFYFSERPSKHFTVIPGKHFTIHTDAQICQIDGEIIPSRNTFAIEVEAGRQRFIVA